MLSSKHDSTQLNSLRCDPNNQSSSARFTSHNGQQNETVHNFAGRRFPVFKFVLLTGECLLLLNTQILALTVLHNSLNFNSYTTIHSSPLSMVVLQTHSLTSSFGELIGDRQAHRKAWITIMSILTQIYSSVQLILLSLKPTIICSLIFQASTVTIIY